jgi:hypothetical protein
MTFRSIAIEALNTLTFGMMEEIDPLKSCSWPLVDKIERRFGLREHVFTRILNFQKQTADYLKEQSLRHDALDPDRRSYLHR